MEVDAERFVDALASAANWRQKRRVEEVRQELLRLPDELEQEAAIIDAEAGGSPMLN
jgi:uncharacterized protein YjiS (DUF1127 family)